MKFRFTQGMLMHPFSDQSGVAFFDPNSALVSSISVKLETLKQWMLDDKELTETQRQALQQLCEEGFIVETSSDSEQSNDESQPRNSESGAYEQKNLQTNQNSKGGLVD